MEILVIIITNLFTGALIYLILSLKIERTTSTYHEQKLKREMGEIITEFNAAAERNITVLENRISLLRNINSEKGSSKPFDYTVGDEEFVDNSSIFTDSLSAIKNDVKEEVVPETGKSFPVTPESSDESVFGSIMNKFSFLKKNTSETTAENNTPDPQHSFLSDQSVYGESGSSLIEKRVVTGKNLDFRVEDEVDLNEQIPDENIEELFDASEDKYSLINDLHGKGYTIEDLAKSSGIPAGEVRLIISLNS